MWKPSFHSIHSIHWTCLHMCQGFSGKIKDLPGLIWASLCMCVCVCVCVSISGCELQTTRQRCLSSFLRNEGSSILYMISRYTHKLTKRTVEANSEPKTKFFHLTFSSTAKMNSIFHSFTVFREVWSLCETDTDNNFAIHGYAAAPQRPKCIIPTLPGESSSACPCL